jgi:hypothetical protein
MKELIRNWLRSYKDRRSKHKLQVLLGTKLKTLVDACETIVVEHTGEYVYTKIRDLGGVNNFGMLIHYSIKNNEPLAISKIERYELAERENRFLQWQKEYRNNDLSAQPFGITAKTEEDYTCFISSILIEPKQFSYSKAKSLYQRLGNKPDLLSYLAIKGKKETLINEIDDSTNIKSILVHLVSQFSTESAEVFYKKIILNKKKLLSKKPSFFIDLQECMQKSYNILSVSDLSSFEGLVHGDFKAQNILEDDELYKVIDCQYYTYGIRLWDMAFLYSKNEKFQNIEHHIDKFPLIEERLFIVFFYLLATMVNAKQKRAARILRDQLLPALEYLKHLLNSL